MGRTRDSDAVDVLVPFSCFEDTDLDLRVFTEPTTLQLNAIGALAMYFEHLPGC